MLKMTDSSGQWGSAPCYGATGTMSPPPAEEKPAFVDFQAKRLRPKQIRRNCSMISDDESLVFEGVCVWCGAKSTVEQGVFDQNDRLHFSFFFDAKVSLKNRKKAQRWSHQKKNCWLRSPMGMEMNNFTHGDDEHGRRTGVGARVERSLRQLLSRDTRQFAITDHGKCSSPSHSYKAAGKESSWWSMGSHGSNIVEDRRVPRLQEVENGLVRSDLRSFDVKQQSFNPSTMTVGIGF